MANSTIFITPVTNIENNAVVSNALVTEKTYDSDMDVHLFECNGKRRMGNLMSVSLCDDVLVVDEINHVILRMLTK